MEHKHTLEEERRVLLAELNHIARHNTETNEWEAVEHAAENENADTNTTADRFEDFEEKSALVTPLAIRLTEVEQALAKMNNGTYGTCEICGNPIEHARLSANPAAKTCMKHL